MNTKLAINLLTENSNNLSNTLAALDLLSNGETISSLQLKVEQSIKTAFEKHQQLSSKVDTVEDKLGQIENELLLAVSNQSIEQERLANLQKQQNELEITIQSLQDRKQMLSGDGDGHKAAIKAEIEVIKANITKTEAEVAAVKQQITDGLALVASYDSFIQQAQTAQEQANYHNQYVQNWVKMGEKRLWKSITQDVYNWVTDEVQVNLRDSYQVQANQLNQQAASILEQVNSFKQSLPILEETKNIKTNQVWLYYYELEAKNNLLSFASTQSGNDLALLDLQLSQSQTDLTQLKDTDIPSQKAIVDSTTGRVIQVQSELDQLKTQKVSAQQDLDTFVENNKELLATDLSLNLLQDSITQVQTKITSLQENLAQSNQSTDILNGLTQALSLKQGKLEKLEQQYQLLALEALEINQGRLESLNGQLAAETSASNAVQVNTIAGYVDLVPQFVQQLRGLSDVWAENLKDNHQFTVDVNNLFQSNLTAFEGVAGYIEDNLADPYSDYVLNGIQLDEAIIIQDQQINYRNALAKTVDDLGENIELQKKSVEQTELLSTQLIHISQLIDLEKEYATLENDYAIFDQQWLNLSNDRLQKLTIRQQKEQQLAQAQQAYNDRIAIANSRGAVFNPTTGSYYFLTDSNTWTETQNFAQSLGANLVSINDANEEAWIFNNFSQAISPYYVGGDNGYTYFPQLWIGLTDKDQEGVWKWANGDPVTFTNFGYYIDYGSGDAGSWGPLPNTNVTNFATIRFGQMTYGSEWAPASEEAYGEYYSSPIQHSGIIELDFKVVTQQINNAQQQLETAQSNENSALQSLQNFELQRVPLDNRLNQLSPLIVNELAKEIANETQDFTVQIDLANDLQEQWIETSLQKYIQQKESNIIVSINGLNQNDHLFYKLQLTSNISALQNLRLEIAHLTLQTEQNPNKIQQFLEEYEAGDKTATTLRTLRDKYYPELNQATTLANLQTQINQKINESQQQIEGIKADSTQKQAQSAAALSQADWYEQQATTHWQLSRKAGPTWTEQRSYTERNWYGKKKTNGQLGCGGRSTFRRGRRCNSLTQ
ncbi:hypothetical protein H6G97_37875 [Nostoc flagelliforme FACHB-838]|uniref:C-type lectin domain-containing protein n=1 Tax=Nostoc flagelliforme FACHB-838 TaxID=2692904 RepID=A0ABR8E2V1_9NOSO|nr:lectin-like protein [Nostoc flagelliforme]MBD2534900.1 hypothetical protein [Nostoc flagelliforme FACHB-838]